jgi:hypothetical protein
MAGHHAVSRSCSRLYTLFFAVFFTLFFTPFFTPFFTSPVVHAVLGWVPTVYGAKVLAKLRSAPGVCCSLAPA